MIFSEWNLYINEYITYYMCSDLWNHRETDDNVCFWSTDASIHTTDHKSKFYKWYYDVNGKIYIYKMNSFPSMVLLTSNDRNVCCTNRRHGIIF